ncbi:hypothetical protein I7I51_07951 [Histoplasma capsulatum]|uniref:Uncharacterized protein n=1 Tax=Ajellomyces capsulatus TaxID=5037 RepID=A0A8A1M1I5_AJECA|nr:hypothetical protein I7I51_07951 [Histoplasma capsulatum]
MTSPVACFMGEINSPSLPGFLGPAYRARVEGEKQAKRPPMKKPICLVGRPIYSLIPSLPPTEGHHIYPCLPTVEKSTWETTAGQIVQGLLHPLDPELTATILTMRNPEIEADKDGQQSRTEYFVQPTSDILSDWFVSYGKFMLVSLQPYIFTWRDPPSLLVSINKDGSRNDSSSN